ncbi:ricin B lectin domain-containing protein [Favolaschia claudopus]|uniref:Ricin B lectin domain-containing protein n=1 Tax=Favolaschia claudopus TaxID=2862362 RepID=A0AAW0ALZ6_9AGAR
MFSSSCSLLFAFLYLLLSATAIEIRSLNPAFANAGIHGCIAAAENKDGAPLIITDCDKETPANLDWNLTFFSKQSAGPQQIKVFGDKCIDLKDGAKADGAKLQIWTCAGGNTNQQWISVTNSALQLSGTNQCIDLTDGKITAGTVLQTWTCDPNNNSNQRWGPGTTPGSVIVGQIFGNTVRTIDDSPSCIAAASDTDGAEVALVGCVNSDFHTTFPNGNITWTIPAPPLSGPIKIFNNKCLDVPNGSTENGVKLQIWTCAQGNANQIFSTPHLGGAQIEWNGKGKCLDLLTSGIGTPISMVDCAEPENADANQVWYI